MSTKKKKKKQLKSACIFAVRKCRSFRSLSIACRIETERCVSSSVLGEYKIQPVIRDRSNCA